MFNNLEKPDAGVMELVGGIITDVHLLTKQQLALFRHEMKGEIGHAREAGTLVAIGASVLIVGSILLCQMFVQLIAWIAPEIPLWGCYAIVGTPVAAIGGYVCMLGIQKFKKTNTATVELAHDRMEKADG
jgi:hypothetical protein